MTDACLHSSIDRRPDGWKCRTCELRFAPVPPAQPVERDWEAPSFDKLNAGRLQFQRLLECLGGTVGFPVQISFLGHQAGELKAFLDQLCAVLRSRPAAKGKARSTAVGLCRRCAGVPSHLDDEVRDASPNACAGCGADAGVFMFQVGRQAEAVDEQGREALDGTASQESRFDYLKRTLDRWLCKDPRVTLRSDILAKEILARLDLLALPNPATCPHEGIEESGGCCEACGSVVEFDARKGTP